MNLPQNLFDGNISAQVILCQADKTRIGEILPYDLQGTFKFNTYSEISFSIDKYYNDLFDGKTKINPYYELIDSIRVIEIRGVGHFVIQDVEENEAEAYTKSVTCFSLEYNTGQKYLENFYVNTGEEGSIETMYHAQQYGAEYSIDNYYVLVDKSRDAFDPYQRYYIKEYSKENPTSYNYVEEQVLDENDYKKDDFELYVKKYPNVRFYWPTKSGLSLLHHVFDRIPEWKIGHVDKELWYQERTFSEDRTAVYDFLYNTAAETFKFVMVWDSISGTCSFYKTEEDGVITNNYVRTNTYNPSFEYYSDDIGTKADPQPTSEDDVVNGVFYINIGKGIETQWDTDVFISRENLASNIDIKYSTDDIKTKLKITGADNLDIRDVNLGQNYITNLSFYKDPLWMGPDLAVKYGDYENLLTKKTAEYKKLMSEWSATYNEYSDLMNYVPVEPRVMLVGDEFEKLYCVYNQYKPAPKKYDSSLTYFKYDASKDSDDYLTYVKASPQPQNDNDLKNGQYYVIPDLSTEDPLGLLVKRLQRKLETYKVDQRDGKPSEMALTEDVLLTLENDASDSATIRVRYDENGKDYCVYRTRTEASTGVSNTVKFTLKEWINGDLTADYESNDGSNRSMNLAGFKIKSIGTLGAYFCLVRDEMEKVNLEDYGIRLLQEKQDTYTKIFITQTEGYMNQEGSQCIASDELPAGNEYPDGTKWLNTGAVDGDGNLIMRIREGGSWVNYTPDDNDYENYARFYENYTKLGNVQAILTEKQYQADMLLNGVARKEFYIAGENAIGDKLLANLLLAAQAQLVIKNNRYVVSIAQPPSDYETEGTLWFQLNEITGKYTTRRYENEKWESYDITDIINITGSLEIIQVETNNETIKFPYLIFTSAIEPDTKYAIWVVNGTPHVAYAHSQGLTLAKMDLLKTATDMNKFFSEQELVRLSPFIREDEYSDDNFLLTGYESEEEQMYIKQELLNAGVEELNKISRPKLSFDMTMANILAIPEFAPLKNQFKLGNFVRVGIREKDYKPERARLLEVQINFDDASDFSCTFGNLISTKSEIDKHADLMQQAVTAGKSVASNKSFWQKGADKATALDNAINNGLRDAALSVGAADGQAITWDRYGIRGRKLIDGTTDQYHDEQFALINNKLAFTTDNWKTSRAVVGEFEVEIDEQKQKMYGLLADALIGGYIQGTEIRGGNLRIGDGTNNYFQVDEKGDVKIVQAGKEKYASADVLNQIDQLYKYRVVLSYDGPAIFASTDDEIETTITATVYERGNERDKDITDTIDASKFSWIRSSSDANSDINWNSAHKGVKQITVNHKDVIENSHFSCQVDMD